MPSPDRHLLLIPSYNTGPRLLSTVRDALAAWHTVWVVIDGSTDRSEKTALALAATEPRLRIINNPTNSGKGAAVLLGAEAALAAGFTHALVMDADGQHPLTHITPFMQASAENPGVLVIGTPQFGPEVPLERLYGRKLSVALVQLETLSRRRVLDPLFGFRVYPLAPLLAALRSTRFARRYDFDPEVAVRMVWAGTPTLNLPAPCRYLAKTDGGVSHFHYLRDNLRMIWLHTRLLLQLPFHLRPLLKCPMPDARFSIPKIPNSK